ncbi:MAG: hypothetical protein ACR2NV_02560 [Thermoleophilaceae bacterium]
MDERRLSASFERLDPVDRAILELSKRRGMTDDEIADVMRSTPTAVTRRRRQSVDRIAVWMGAADADDRRGVDRDLHRLLASDGATSIARAGAGARTATEPAGRRGGWIVAVVVVIALAVLGAALGIGLSRAGQGTAEGPGAPVATPEARRAPAGSGSGPTRTARLTPLGGDGGRSSAVARVRPRAGGRRLELEVGRLPAGGARYGLWLFNTQADAVALAAFRRVPLSLSVPLPDDAARYRYIDVSAEPRDGNANHSGRSLLRVPTAALLSTS